ncbi:MAG: hypothetical protein IJA61_04740 [Clostridia bacterium]|nr:hypothetical protein [Clostridia bacterium]
MNTDKIYANKIALEYSSLTSRKAKSLQRLDDWIKKSARITSIIIGLFSTLLFIVGLAFHIYLLGLCAIIGVTVNLYIFAIILHKRKKENENDILLLAQEVLDEND